MRIALGLTAVMNIGSALALEAAAGGIGDLLFGGLFLFWLYTVRDGAEG